MATTIIALINHIAARPALIGRGIYQTRPRTIPGRRANHSSQEGPVTPTDQKGARSMLRRLMLAAFALAALLAIGASPSYASSHREAPLISADPQADLNDLYAYRDYADPSKVNFLITLYPLEEPG